MHQFVVLALPLVVSSLLLYLFSLAIYRVWLSPVAHIPGPLLAKLTYWYEFYWDVVKVGQLTFQLPELHAKYGPIIRINPHEVHISDPDYYDEVNAGSSSGKKRNKWAWTVESFGVPDSTFATVDHDLHRMRRAALNPFFSKAKVRTLQSTIEDVVYRLLRRFEEFKELQQPAPIGLAFTAVSNDIASSYAFDQKQYRIDAPDFAPDFHRAGEKVAKQSSFGKQFPWVLTTMQKLPDSFILWLDSDMGAYIGLQRNLQQRCKAIEIGYKSADYKAPERTTVFHEILSSTTLPASQKHHARLWQDAQTVVIAGTVTTATNLSNLTYFLLTQPNTLKQVRDELFSAIPYKTAPLNLSTLESLPYLTAFLMETLRFSNGISTRLQRIDPYEPLVFHARKDNTLAPAPQNKTYIIPPNTPISMTALLIHRNPSIFPTPLTFNPARWLAVDPETGKQSLHHRLDKYFLPFGRGTRNCLGMNLAWAELYLLVAMLFRRYGSRDDQRDGDEGYLELFETTYELDIEIAGDGVTPIVREPFRGVRVMVRPCDAKG